MKFKSSYRLDEFIEVLMNAEEFPRIEIEVDTFIQDGFVGSRKIRGRVPYRFSVNKDGYEKINAFLDSQNVMVAKTTFGSVTFGIKPE